MDSSLAENEQPVGLTSIWTHFKIPIILGSVSLLLIILSVVLLVKSVQTATPIQFSHEEISNQASDTASIKTMVTVDVEGAVVKPGVYQLALGSRVEDAIVTAGGLDKDVDETVFAKTINRATKLSDGAKLYIPRMGESLTSHNADSLSRRLETSYNESRQVSVNTASQSELESRPGIGPVTASKIIANRPYGSLNELISKKAMSQSLLEKLKDQLSL